jgi:hypothetical protein
MTADTMRTAAPPKQPSMRRLIVTATIGNVFEWFGLCRLRLFRRDAFGSVLSGGQLDRVKGRVPAP